MGNLHTGKRSKANASITLVITCDGCQGNIRYGTDTFWHSDRCDYHESCATGKDLNGCLKITPDPTTDTERKAIEAFRSDVAAARESANIPDFPITT